MHLSGFNGIHAAVVALVPCEVAGGGMVAAPGERTATKPKSARFDWGDGSSRVNVAFLEKGEAKSTVTLEHSRLADSEDRDRMKAWWRERLTALRSGLQGGELDA